MITITVVKNGYILAADIPEGPKVNKRTVQYVYETKEELWRGQLELIIEIKAVLEANEAIELKKG